jgi:hypothetical protein
LTLSEAAEAAAGMDDRAKARRARTEHQQETRRRVAGLLSDGTMPEAMPDEDTLGLGSDRDRLIGMPARPAPPSELSAPFTTQRPHEDCGRPADERSGLHALGGPECAQAPANVAVGLAFGAASVS